MRERGKQEGTEERCGSSADGETICPYQGQSKGWNADALRGNLRRNVLLREFSWDKDQNEE